MAVADTGRIFKAFIFDGESSRKYGVYISGEAVYNAPERDVEMITIPNRNGTFVLDKGRFNNIEVRYPAGIFADTEENFAKAVSDLRNFLCSRKGYCKLTDEYNPNEYRMAVYKSGLEVTPANRKAGEFEIVFDCKPQRYLETGEIPLTIESGKKIINPTLFESSPMLEVTGYGGININTDTITVENVPLGEIKIGNSAQTASATLDVSNLNSGDAIFSNSNTAPYATLTIKKSSQSGQLNVDLRSGVTNGSAYVVRSGAYVYRVLVYPFTSGGVSFVKGTNGTITTTVPLKVVINDVVTNCTLTLTTTYNASTNKITMSLMRSDFPSSGLGYSSEYQHPAYYGDSTKTILPQPMYIDLDIGEAYGIVNGEMVSFNNTVQIPAELPKLKVSDNAITYDNTVTDLKIIPRWWKI